VLKILRDVSREEFVSETPHTKCGVLTELLCRYGKRNQREIGEFMGIHDSALSSPLSKNIDPKSWAAVDAVGKIQLKLFFVPLSLFFA
jgi:hypothetical protein